MMVTKQDIHVQKNGVGPLLHNIYIEDMNVRPKHINS